MATARWITERFQTPPAGRVSHQRLLTLHQVVVGLPPGVAVLRRQDADGLLVGLQGGVPDLLQLHVELVHRQPGPVAVVHVQHEELGRGGAELEHHGAQQEQRRHLGYLEVVDHGDVSGRSLPDGVIHHRVSLWTGDAAGGQDLVVLVHAQRLPAQVFHREAVAATQTLT